MDHNRNCLKKVVALDVESVIADTHKAWITKYNKSFTTDDITDWDFKSLNDWNENLESFLDETDTLWNNNPEKNIPAMVPNLKEVTTHLKPFDIVTSRGTLSGIKKWVDYHQLEYRAIVFISDKQSKAELKYDIYIDDNPSLASKLSKSQFLWLVSQPYNQDVQESKQVRRITSILEITKHR